MSKKPQARKAIAARALVDSLPSSKSLSRNEKRAVAQIVCKSKDGDLPDLTTPEAERIAERPHVRDVIVEALVKIGVTPDRLAKVLSEGLDAERSLVAGDVVMSVKDHGIRHKFLETALRVVGGTHQDQEQSRPSNVFVFRSFLGERPVDVKIGAPVDAIVKRRLKAAKVSNRVNG